jgi:hypothetical protein
VTPTSAPERAAASLVSEIGELVGLDRLHAPLEVPIGEYRLTGLELDLRGAGEGVWSLYFWGDGRRRVRVERDAEIVLLDQLTVDFRAELTPASGSHTGVRQITPRLAAASGLEATLVTARRRRHDETVRPADVRVSDVAGRQVAANKSGFM